MMMMMMMMMNLVLMIASPSTMPLQRGMLAEGASESRALPRS